jgi:putative heme iron utilization protein
MAAAKKPGTARRRNAPMDEADLRALAQLIGSQRAAALGTLHQGGPYVSLVLYAAGAGLTEYYLHLSRLAIHTRNLQADRRAALMIAQPEAGHVDPQTLMRLSLQGAAEPLPRQAADYAAARARYLARFPQAAPIFDLADFDLYRLTPAEGRFIAAFGKILNITAEHLRQASAL